MKTIALTYSHKEIQFQIFAAVCEGLRSADLTGRGFFITYGGDDSDFRVELWRSATKPENGDGKLLYSHKINKGEYQMNDIRLGVMTRYIKHQCEKFVDEMTPILMKESGSFGEPTFSLGEDQDLYDFANYALQNASAIASNKAGETIKFGVTMADVTNWTSEFRPHYAKKN